MIKNLIQKAFKIQKTLFTDIPKESKFLLRALEIILNLYTNNSECFTIEEI